LLTYSYIIYLFIRLFIHLVYYYIFTYLLAYLFIHILFIYLFIRLSIYLFHYYIFIYLLICSFVYYLFIYLFAYSFIYYLFIRLFITLLIYCVIILLLIYSLLSYLFICSFIYSDLLLFIYLFMYVQYMLQGSQFWQSVQCLRYGLNCHKICFHSWQALQISLFFKASGPALVHKTSSAISHNCHLLGGVKAKGARSWPLISMHFRRWKLEELSVHPSMWLNDVMRGANYLALTLRRM